VETWQTSEAGRHFQTLVDGVSRGDWQLIGDEGRPDAVLADPGELAELIGVAFRFRPKATFGEFGAELWLPELGVHVAGTSLEAARSELAVSLVRIAHEWDQQRAHDPAWRLNAGYLRRVQLAGGEEGVLAMLDRDAAAEGVPEASARTWQEADATKPRRWMGPHARIAQVREALSQGEDRE